MVKAKKLLAILGGLALLLGLAAGASAQPSFEDSFTISALAVGCETNMGVDFTMEVTITNMSGSDLSDIKIQGGTAAWVMWVADGTDDRLAQVENPQGKLLPAHMGNPPRNNNVILGATGLSLPDGESETFMIVVNGVPDLEECPDGPNVLGSWSASGMNEEGEDVEAIAVDADDMVLFDDMTMEPLTETPEVLACDENFDCLELPDDLDSESTTDAIPPPAPASPSSTPAPSIASQAPTGQSTVRGSRRGASPFRPSQRSASSPRSGGLVAYFMSLFNL